MLANESNRELKVIDGARLDILLDSTNELNVIGGARLGKVIANESIKE